MENAGRNCAEVLLDQITSTSSQHPAVVVLCGPGNNGGDGFVIARHLYVAGIPSKVICLVSQEKYAGDAQTNLTALSRLDLELLQADASWTTGDCQREISTCYDRKTSWIVDAMLGTGAKGEPRSPIDGLIQSANLADAKRMAIDIPSGLDCDTGQPAKSTFRADLTCTFIESKTGFAHQSAAEFTGEVLVVGIGAPAEITERVRRA